MKKLPLHKKWEITRPGPEKEHWKEKQGYNQHKPDSYGFYDMVDEFNSFLNEDAVGPHDLPDDIKVVVKFKPEDSGMILFVDKYGEILDQADPIYGQMWLSYKPECDGYMIQWVKASRGFGPMLYDLAMELVAKNDSWLMSDRTAVTAEAERIWEYYDKHRNDVEKEPIGLGKDCSFKAAIKATKYHQIQAKKRGIDPIYDDWEKHPLAFKWRKPQADTMMVLKSKGQIARQPLRENLEEEMRAKYADKYDQVIFELPLREDEFVHFTPAKRALEILKSGKLLMDPPYKKFGTDAVSAVSLTYGTYLPGVQTTHIADDEGQIVAVKFKTDTLPQIGFVEEVSWQEDVNLIDPKVITHAKAKRLLENTPEYKRVNKLDWGFVKYTR